MDNKSDNSATEKSETLDKISDNCNDILEFLKSVTVKSPCIIAAPLLLLAEKRVHASGSD